MDARHPKNDSHFALDLPSWQRVYGVTRPSIYSPPKKQDFLDCHITSPLHFMTSVLKKKKRMFNIFGCMSVLGDFLMNAWDWITTRLKRTWRVTSCTKKIIWWSNPHLLSINAHSDNSVHACEDRVSRLVSTM